MTVLDGRTTLQPTRVALPGGLTLLHNRTPSNASVVTRVMLPAGACREGAGQAGLAAFTGRMLRQGSAAMTKDALAEELDGLGAGLSVDVSYGLVSGSMKCLNDDFARTTQLLGEVLRRPSFADAEIEQVRGQMLTDMRELEDSTRMEAERVWRQMAYPADHRYHRLPFGTPETLAAFSRVDLEQFHQHNYGPDQALVVVVGDVTREQATSAITKAFTGWPGVRTGTLLQALPPTAPPRREKRAHPMVGKTQCDVVVGTTTIDRANPDYYTLSFANHILGRMYFMGRFGEKVRDEQGLAYYAYSDLSASFGSGPWTVRAGVNPKNLQRALDSIGTEVARFLADGPTEEEHADAVRSILGSLPRALETNEGMAAVLGEIQLYDLGLDYIDRYPQIIGSLAPESVLSAARRWIQPENLVTAIAGPATDSA